MAGMAKDKTFFTSGISMSSRRRKRRRFALAGDSSSRKDGSFACRFVDASAKGFRAAGRVTRRGLFSGFLERTLRAPGLENDRAG